MNDKLKVAFIHPDLGIGGAERLVIDAALGLQRLGHSVDIYTSHHDPAHCFDETRDGTLRVHHVKSPFSRSYKDKFHILFAHLRQLHLTAHLLRTDASRYDVYFVDQLSTCVPFLRTYAKRRVVFYCHFPDKLLADGAFVGGTARRRKGSALKRLYRLPMDWFEEKTTGSADVLLANSRFTAGVFNSFFSIPRKPRVIYPGINISAYAPPSSSNDPNVQEVISDRPTLLSLNRFEKKKNIALALNSFALLRQSASGPALSHTLRLVLAGGYDPRIQDNFETLKELIEVADSKGLSYWITTPSHTTPPNLPSPSASNASAADILFLLSFTTPQRSALLTAPSTLALLYTPTNEHFGIGPVEGMACGVPVLACDSGGPTESVVTAPSAARTGWLVPPDADAWAEALREIVALDAAERAALGDRARVRAESLFGMEAMALALQEALRDAVRMGPIADSSCTSDVLLAVMISLLAYLIYRFIV
ncbi:mannosyltransferase [Phellopilus nigrolimitatus]|nr:mannosyltransferase [Phellopilus nigrolimitatus]